MGRRNPRSRYSTPRRGRTAPTIGAGTPAGWLFWRVAGPVAVVVGPVVVGTVSVVVDPEVVGARLVVVPSVVVDATVLVGALVVGTVLVGPAVVEVGPLVVGSTVVGGAVVVSPAVVGALVVAARELLAPLVEGAVAVPSAAAGAWAPAGWAVGVGPLPARCPELGVVDDRVVVVGSRLTVVLVEAAVGVGLVGDLGSATLGSRGGGWGWGNSVAEATRAARTAVASPKMNSSSRQGRRGGARCRGGGVGMVHCRGSADSFGS
jgi:hypothetical protein